jgi:alginate O-acetyltransferase complex protein AlgI
MSRRNAPPSAIAIGEIYALAYLMLFNSYEFIFVFLPVVLLGYLLLVRSGHRAVISWLAIASIAFYGYWKPAFLLVLAASIVMNYLCSRLIIKAGEEPKFKRLVLAAGVCANLLLLGYYKYFFPFLSFLTEHGVLHHEWQNVLLPLGISFFTFTQIGYLIDLAQGEAMPQPLTNYILFVTFFPHLIAGPIFHHREVMPQFAEDRRRMNIMDLTIGATWFIMGLFKKVAIADVLATTADSAFAHPGALTLFVAWEGVLCYAMQLYFDFSGYSDMAIGLARMFSIEFPLNFDSPYKSTNITEYWQRWHMTLTRYLNLYLYNPIALSVGRRRLAKGKKVSRKAAATPEGFANMIAFPTMTTMFLAGIWHGAGLQFLILGLLHGTYLTIHQAWIILRQKHIPARGTEHTTAPMAVVASVLLTFLCVIIGQVFFRSSSVHTALLMLASMAGAHGISLSPPILHLLGPLGSSGLRNQVLLVANWSRSDLRTGLQLATALIVVWACPNTQQILGRYAHRDTTAAVATAKSKSSVLWNWTPNMLWAASFSVILLLCLLLMQNPSRFLYFQF